MGVGVDGIVSGLDTTAIIKAVDDDDTDEVLSAQHERYLFGLTSSRDYIYKTTPTVVAKPLISRPQSPPKFRGVPVAQVGAEVSTEVPLTSRTSGTHNRNVLMSKGADQALREHQSDRKAFLKSFPWMITRAS